MSTFGLFSDAGLTVPVATLRHYSTQGDRLFYFGSPAAGKKLEDSASPGVADVLLSINDSAIGTGFAATSVKLASTSGGLSTAVAGDPLVLGTTVLSGVANALPVHMRFDTTGGTVGDTYTDVALRLVSVIESAV